MHKFFPLFLVGSAFSCYKSLDDYVKKDYELLKKAMIEKFCLDPCLAYEKFIRRRLQHGESVEFFILTYVDSLIFVIKKGLMLLLRVLFLLVCLLMIKVK